MFLTLILLAAGQVSFEEKEETCFFLTNSAQKLRYKEIETHLAANPQLERQKMVVKVFEDSFELCIRNISDDEVRQIGLKRIRDFQPYIHLFTTDLTKYTKGEDLHVSKDLLERKMRIAKRISKGNTKSADF